MTNSTSMSDLNPYESSAEGEQPSSPEAAPTRPEAGSTRPEATPTRPLGKIILVAVIGLIAIVVLTQFRQYLSLEALAQRESELRDFQARNPYVVYGIAFAIYATATGLSLPVAAAMTLVYGWYFQFWPAFVVVSFASTLGATLTFLVSRYLLRDTVQAKFGDRLKSFNHHLESEGPFYLFTLRLIPAVPFFVINLVMGLTPMKTRTYWWVSQLGMLPGTVVYVYAGSRVPNLTVLAEEGAAAVFTPSQLSQLTFAFAMLGLFPLIVKKIMNRVRGTSVAIAEDADS